MSWCAVVGVPFSLRRSLRFVPDDLPRPFAVVGHSLGLWPRGIRSGRLVFIGFINVAAGGLLGIAAGVGVYFWRKRFLQQRAEGP